MTPAICILVGLLAVAFLQRDRIQGWLADAIPASWVTASLPATRGSAPVLTPPFPSLMDDKPDPDEKFFEAVGHIRAVQEYFTGIGDKAGARRAAELGAMLFVPIAPQEVQSVAI